MPRGESPSTEAATCDAIEPGLPASREDPGREAGRRPRGRRGTRALAFLPVAVLLAASCVPPKRSDASAGARYVVATYALLGALAGELAGPEIRVTVMIPNGFDLHEWEPSAKEMELLAKAGLVVENGLGLEAGMAKALDAARRAGARFFTAAEHADVRRVAEGEAARPGDPDQRPGVADPHLWTDPATMRPVVRALAEELGKDFGLDLSARAADLDGRLAALDSEIAAKAAALPPGARKLVTGHESLGYFAQRYGFKLVGAVIPGFSTEAAGSAEDLAALKRLIEANGVKVVFTEVGTPDRTVAALAREAGVRAVPLATHALPADGSYLSYARGLADTIIGALK